MLNFDLRGRRGAWVLEARAQLEGGCVGLFGQSGAGKSSLLQMLTGLLRPEGGTIELNGRTIYNPTTGLDLPAHRRGISVVFQDNLLFPHFDVEGNLRYGRKSRDSRTNPITFESVVEILKLAALLDRRPSKLSGGERRRVAIGRALLASPELLLLDEPMTGLDAGLKSEILSFLQRIRDELKIPMIYVSHQLEDILKLTRKLWFLHDGRLMGQGDYLDLALDSKVVSRLLTMGLVNVLDLSVQAHDPQAGCTTFEPSPGGANRQGDSVALTLQGPLVSAAPGSRIQLTLRPEDVALSPEPVPLISVRNQVRGKVRRQTEAGGRAILEVDIGLPLVVEISSGSREKLGLAEGREVWCLIKATALKTSGFSSSATD